MNQWIGAGIAVLAGVLIGGIASRLVRGALSRSKVQAIRESSAALAGLVLSMCFIVGLLVALGFVASEELDQLGNDAIGFLPKLISALIIVIVANVASTFAASAVAKALAGTGAAARFAPVITKFAILAGGGIVAAGQADVDTNVINIAVAALLFGVAGSLALLTGLGGRQVAGEIAAGRAWRNALRSGDRIEAVISGGRQASLSGSNEAGSNSVGTVAGVVVEVHPTAIELNVTGTTVFVPNSRLLDSVVARDRPEPANAEGEIERR